MPLAVSQAYRLMQGPPSISDQLDRLKMLESDFQRLLETEKLEAMAEFAAGAGHEINNPLTVISGRAQLLLRDEIDPERRHALALISAQAKRVYEMIADMMLFARPPRIEPEQVDLSNLIDEMIVELSPVGQRQETDIRRINQSRGPIVIEADAVQIGVALRAICRNSLEAIQSGGRIEIGLETKLPSPASVRGVWGEGSENNQQPITPLPNPPPKDEEAEQNFPKREGTEWVAISIRDNGPGIKPEERRHLFDPFYSARQAGRGLGLGLSKAWRIIANHGGRIEVESQPSHGATFTVRLPKKPVVVHPMFNVR
ncbi:MAG: hypothetical protein JW959_08275 [Pirellulales bacterium]|nr:hypothetical protein [Pirellulales bacterium]